jgi:acetyl-CoA carboxylase biotin carboxyl carrier protein
MSEVEIDPKMLKALLEAFEGSDWEELSLALPTGDSLYLSRNPDGDLPALSSTPASSTPPPAFVGPAPAQADSVPGPRGGGSEAPPAATNGAAAGGAASDATGVPVESTTVGIFWVAPSPSAPPFVSVGDQVTAEDTVGIVEVMKLMNHVPAGIDGTVTAVLVANGEAVEFGQSLVLIDPAG